MTTISGRRDVAHGRTHSRESPSRPVRVALVHDVPLMAHGLVGMLAPYADRVSVVLGDAPGRERVDLCLFDPFVHRPDEVMTEIRGLLRGYPRWASWSWETRRVNGRWSLPDPVAYLDKRAEAGDLVAQLVCASAGRLVTGDRALLVGRQHGLSVRQTEVLMAISRGMSNAEIMAELHVSANTVKSYVRAAYKTLGVTNRSQALLWAVENGLRPEASAGAEASSPAGPPVSRRIPARGGRSD